MTVLFMGSEMESFVDNSGTLTAVTTSGYFDASTSRCAVRAGTSGATNNFSAFLAGSSSTLWTHLNTRLSGPGTGANKNFIQWLSAGTPVFRAVYVTTNSNVVTFQYWNGTAWVNVGTTWTTTSAIVNELDIHLIGGSSGSFELFVSGASIASGTASMPLVTGIDELRFFSASSSGTATAVAYYSEIIVKTDSTIGCRLYTLPPSGDGAETSWVGTYTDINEIVTNDSTIIAGSVVGDKETVVHASISPALGVVEAVAVSGRARNGSSGPKNMKTIVRVGGVNYLSSTHTLSSGWLPTATIWEQNPATSSAWSMGTAFAVTTEFGYEAET